eukprot:CAMPEP_0177427244 /NCGR_PEP_ID=MMETSP0368-20130122/73959_1 /TAXON_ID=447022 ORGANISM="Scrippsiella hangoei-like, Strain SHHI-4" /NCGR_SAMPLE_ID=MMETSP0368 /ASSEMBLY_ACC=CAM_ASM_000363 /LENGTH=155 /DNA_ID=CAMNT_0018897637 /DNA_START=262 /DNA_END=729 /DNA_ORIENTATION=-
MTLQSLSSAASRTFHGSDSEFVVEQRLLARMLHELSTLGAAMLQCLVVPVVPRETAAALEVLPHDLVAPAPAVPRAHPAKRFDLLDPLVVVARLLALLSSSSGALVQGLTSLELEPTLRYHVTMVWRSHGGFSSGAASAPVACQSDRHMTKWSHG